MAKFPCCVCGGEMGWDRPSGVCSTACLRKGHGFDPPDDEPDDDGPGAITRLKDIENPIRDE
jgi:hypothetical protein